jgi:hypothetical protein
MFQKCQLLVCFRAAISECQCSICGSAWVEEAAVLHTVYPTEAENKAIIFSVVSSEFLQKARHSRRCQLCHFPLYVEFFNGRSLYNNRYREKLDAAQNKKIETLAGTASLVNLL